MGVSTYIMEIKNYLNNRSQPWAVSVSEKHMRSCQLPTIPGYPYPYHLEERIGTL